MLLAYPRRYRNIDDDGAPVDYSYADSVAEGERRRQSEPIHRTRDDGHTVAAVYPRPRSNAFTQTPTYAPQAPDTLQTAQARVAATRGDDRAAQPPAVPRAGEGGRNHRRAAHYAEQSGAQQPVCGPEQGGSRQQRNSTEIGASASHVARNAAPATRQTPDWLRAAQQNQIPYHPDQTAAGEPTPAIHPKAVDYSTAGYPPELLADQRMQQEATGNAQGVGHRSHVSGQNAHVSRLWR